MRQKRGKLHEVLRLVGCAGGKPVPGLFRRTLHSKGSNPSDEGKGSLSQPVIKPHAGIVEPSLLARLEGREAQFWAELLHRISAKELGLSGRASSRLRIANISTIQQLIHCAQSDLLSITHPEISIAEEIKNKLNSYLAGMLVSRPISR